MNLKTLGLLNSIRLSKHFFIDCTISCWHYNYKPNLTERSDITWTLKWQFHDWPYGECSNFKDVVRFLISHVLKAGQVQMHYVGIRRLYGIIDTQEIWVGWYACNLKLNLNFWYFFPFLISLHNLDCLMCLPRRTIRFKVFDVY